MVSRVESPQVARVVSEEKGAPAPPRIPRRWISIATASLTWGYLILVMGLAALLWLAGDRWWLATLFTFGPRWVAIVPLPFLVFMAVLWRRRSLVLVAVAGAVTFGPIMGFCLPWRALPDLMTTPGEKSIRVMTANIGSGGRQASVLEFIRQERPDLVILQESLDFGELPAESDEEWQVARVGAVFIASRYPILSAELLESERLQPWNRPAGRCTIKTPWGNVQVVGVHLETPREGIQQVQFALWRGARAMDRNTAIRRTESELSSALAAEPTDRKPEPAAANVNASESSENGNSTSVAVSESSIPTIIAGDFNMPVDSTIYRTYWSKWQNAFSVAGVGFGHTKFTTHFGVRIDHILASREWRVRRVRVGPHLGGDHRPVVAELELR